MQLLRLFLASLLALALFLPGKAGALGITCHNALGNQMADNLLGPNHDRELHAILTEFPGAVECGSVWADIHYLVDSFPNHRDIAEHLHWPPHYTAALTYIQNTFPRPYSAEARRLIAFYMGVINHSVSDQWWHGLGVPCKAALEFAEENDTEVGGGVEFLLDLYIKSTLAPGNTPKYDWYVPSDHCEAILHGEGYTQFDGDANAEAMQLSYLGGWLESLIGPAMYLPLKFAMPWTTANYEHFPCGGHWDCLDRSVQEASLRFAELKNQRFPVRGTSLLPLAVQAPHPQIRQRISQHHIRHANPKITCGPMTQPPLAFTAMAPQHPVHEFHAHDVAKRLLRDGIVRMEKVKVAGGWELKRPEVESPAQLMQVLHQVMNGVQP